MNRPSTYQFGRRSWCFVFDTPLLSLRLLPNDSTFRFSSQTASKRHSRTVTRNNFPRYFTSLHKKKGTYFAVNWTRNKFITKEKRHFSIGNRKSCVISGNFFHGKMTTLEKLNFDNLALRSLPIDKETQNYVRQVSGACFSRLEPTPVQNPEVVVNSLPALALIDLTQEDTKHPDFEQYFAGNKLLQGSETASHCYCGHQFGNFAGQLGDGAAIYLGEVINKKGERWEIQLKGAGLTPYSRSADGRKVLRSTIREFLCSEAIHHLSIPTTRAGTCITSDTKVIRDIFYDGNPIQEKASIVLRIAPTFIRFGSFEIFKPVDPETGRRGPSVGQTDVLKQLTDYVVKTFYPELWEGCHGVRLKAYSDFFKEVVQRTAKLVAQWQCVGWCHGVLNTDNMSIIGATIDYGPYGFMDSFDPDFICNASDDGGRYTYAKQPEICKWNLLKLAEALAPLLPLEDTRPLLAEYDDHFEKFYIEQMRKKMGLIKEESGDESLVEAFMDTMAATGADFTNCFRALSILPLPKSVDFKERLAELKEKLLGQCCTLEEQKKNSRPRMHPRQLQMMLAMMQMNPDLLNAMGRGASMITAELDRLEKFKKLSDMTQEQKSTNDREHWETWLEKFVARLALEEEGVTDLDQANQERVKVMNSNNPRFILRNYIAQHAIEQAENGDYSEVQRVLTLLENPYSDDIMLPDIKKPMEAEEGAVEGASCKLPTVDSAKDLSFYQKPPEWAADLRVT